MTAHGVSKGDVGGVRVAPSGAPAQRSPEGSRSQGSKAARASLMYFPRGNSWR